MCGIAGTVGRSPEPDLVTRMCAGMRHRGPDEQRTSVRGDSVLGIARLAVIDVESGHQPVSSPDGAVTVVGNGEIFNHVELRAGLVARGHRFATGSDMEVVVHLYEEEGLDCLTRLNGMFALAIHDGGTGELHLVRDRIGVKPLYWCATGGELRFASELPALLLDPGVPRTVDREALAELMVLTHIPAPRTPLRDVAKLEPGTVLTWRAGRATVRRWWQWPLPLEASDLDDADLHERIRELTVDAVRWQLRSDVPVGILLSGGVDSTAVLWAARELGASVPGYCVDFDEPDGDARFARQVAAELGARLVCRSVGAVDAMQRLPAVAAGLPEPMGDPAVLPSLAICAAAAEDVTVLLSGTGADELWGGYGRYLLPGADPVAAYVADLCVHPEAAIRAALGLSADQPVERRLRELLAVAGRGDAVGDPAAARMYLDGTLSLPAALLPVLDTSSMASSLEARVPLLDHRLVELAALLPGSRRMPGGELKGLFRGALRGYVPDAVLDRPKRGFAPPLAGWSPAELTASLRRLLHAPGGIGDVLDPAPIVAELEPGAASPALRALRTWVLLVADLWWRANLSPAQSTQSAQSAPSAPSAPFGEAGDLRSVVGALS